MLLCINEVECYSQRNDEWTMCPHLNCAKGSLAGATLNDKIYAIGGGDGHECFSDVEMFDPVLERWISSQSMLQKVCLFVTALISQYILLRVFFSSVCTHTHACVVLLWT